MFSERVLELTKKIPEGRVTTYRVIAEHLNTKAFMAVGQALKKNKSPYSFSDCEECENQTLQRIPCHRVVKSDGSIGGFNSGVKKKKALLEKEGIEISKNRIDLDRFLYRF